MLKMKFAKRSPVRYGAPAAAGKAAPTLLPHERHAPPPAAGLEGVVACSSDICLVDGLAGRLLYRGYDAIALAEQSTFEEVAYLLWHGRLPDRDALAWFRDELAVTEQYSRETLMVLRLFPATASPMAVLRTAVSALAHRDEDGDDVSREACLRKAQCLLVNLPWFVTSHHRLRSGQEPILPLPEKSIAWNFLYTLHGEEPPPEHVRALDAALVLHADHELNASTFAARVTAATLSDVYSAVTSGIGALKGPLHGGANEEVMKMLREIEWPDRAATWVQDALARKAKVPGFGHRVYRTDDPRAAVLRDYAERLSRAAGDTHWCDIAREVERTMRAHSKVYPNVDFYSGMVYTTLGIPSDLFTPVFAVSRLAGWIAHILEQWGNNRLIRPRAEYTGPDGLAYLPCHLR